MNILDKTGLTYLWSKIKGKIDAKQNKITYGSTEPTGGTDGDVYLMTTSEDTADKIGDLSTLTTDDKTNIVTAINETNTKNIITARLTSNYTITTASVYETLPLEEWEKIGDKLSINNNGEVVVGTGVHHVKITGNARNTTGTVAGKYVTIQNSSSQQLVQSIVYKPVANQTIMVPLAPATFEVSEGERLSLRVYGAKGDVWVGNNQAYGMLATYITIEVVD